MTYWSFLKTTSAFIVLGYITIAVITGVITFLSTGEVRPLLDNTLGIVVNSDNQAYRAVQEIIDIESHLKNPDKYTDEYLLYLRHRIVMNIAISILVIYTIYLILSFFAGMKIEDPSTKIMIIFFAILIYFVLGAVYNVIIYMFFQESKNILWDVIPMKGLISAIYHSIEIFSMQAPAITQVLNSTASSTAAITNTTGVMNAT